MLNVKLDTGFNIEIDFTITPFHKRMFAWVIDLAVQWAYLIIGYKTLEGIFGMRIESMGWVLVLFGLPPLFYHLLSEITLNGQSVGKKAMGIRVIAADGGHPTISQYLIRWSFRLVDFPIWVLS